MIDNKEITILFGEEQMNVFFPSISFLADRTFHLSGAPGQKILRRFLI